MSISDRRLTAFVCLALLGTPLLGQANKSTADLLFRQSLELSQRGEFAAAEGRLGSALSIYRKLGAAREEAEALFGFGTLANKQNETRKSRVYFEQALIIFRKLRAVEREAETVQMLEDLKFWTELDGSRARPFGKSKSRGTVPKQLEADFVLLRGQASARVNCLILVPWKPAPGTRAARTVIWNAAARNLYGEIQHLPMGYTAIAVSAMGEKVFERQLQDLGAGDSTCADTDAVLYEMWQGIDSPLIVDFEGDILKDLVESIPGK
jgi:tetratricopeptide (TPR) repeat protein